MSQLYSEQEDLYKKKRRLMKNDSPLPKSIYKFGKIDEHLRENFLKNQIWFSSANEFNDPFDCKIPFKIYESSPEFQKLVNKLQEWGAFNIDIEKDKFNPDDIKNAVMDSLQGVFESMGIACFSLNEKDKAIDKSLLLWSHYADSHKGVRLKFDILDDVLYMFSLDKLMNPIINLRKVDYEIDFPDLNYMKNQLNFQIKLISTKSEHWDYENEVRILSTKPGPVQFKKEALSEITFGCNVNETDRNDIIKLIRSCNYPEIKFMKAMKCDDQFALKFEEISEQEILKICESYPNLSK